MFELTVTFDNGPEPSITPGVLDVLARRGVRTTFFVIGSKLASRDARACAERAHAEGHWIGNHTWTHSRPLGENPGAAAAELRSRGRRPRSASCRTRTDSFGRPAAAATWIAGC
jgi:peptidoglycan/xylan/chitin deacetylase (PgdA/CDA1 family)